MLPPGIETVKINVVGEDIAFVSVRVAGIMFNSIRAARLPDGRVQLSEPLHRSKTGREFRYFLLPHSIRSALSEVVTARWPLAAQAARRGPWID